MRKCPRCNEKMETASSAEVITNRCLYCNGVWIDGISLNTLLEHESTTLTTSAIQKDFLFSDKDISRHCPDCTNQDLKQVFVKTVELDYCQECNGLFFDEGELIQLFPDFNTENRSKNEILIATEILAWLLILFSGGA